MGNIIKQFNNQKGYGFISDEQGNDILVHCSGLGMNGFESLDESAEAELDVMSGTRGLQATGVTKL